MVKTCFGCVLRPRQSLVHEMNQKASDKAEQNKPTLHLDATAFLFRLLVPHCDEAQNRVHPSLVVVERIFLTESGDGLMSFTRR